MDLCCLQETRWHIGDVRKINWKDSFLKNTLRHGNDKGPGIVLLAAEWWKNVYEVLWLSLRGMRSLRFILGLRMNSSFITSRLGGGM